MKITEHNVETGKIIERDATKEEIAQAKLDALNDLTWKAKLEADLSAKSALLEKLGITAEEAKLLLA
jgi:hypothetical protein